MFRFANEIPLFRSPCCYHDDLFQVQINHIISFVKPIKGIAVPSEERADPCSWTESVEHYGLSLQSSLFVTTLLVHVAYDFMTFLIVILSQLGLI